MGDFLLGEVWLVYDNESMTIVYGVEALQSHGGDWINRSESHKFSASR
jgi:hypothetical protein